MTKNGYSVAVVGATGLVGREMISILEERAFPVLRLVPVASERSEDELILFSGFEYATAILKPEVFNGIDIALFSAGCEVSKEFAPIAAKKGAIVIDNSSAFRMDKDVPLVVPEVNPEDVMRYKNRGIIANPNCSTIQLVVVLKPLHDSAIVKRVVVSTYQSVSGAGKSAIDELSDQTRDIFNQRKIKKEVFPHQIAFNCIPHIDLFDDDGYTREEKKVILETKKIMHAPELKVTATAVRVPVFYSHSEAVNIEFEKDISPEDARRILSKAKGVRVIDDIGSAKYPLAIDAAGTDDVFVGRIRRDTTVESGLDCWIVADNLRKGAALNAVQIAELLV